jgi:ppGpp synthetase/RelA/SpoT-type nucleotidyltranferase
MENNMKTQEMKDIEKLVNIYSEKEFEFSQFLEGVYVFFNQNPILNSGNLPVIHSIKKRLKDKEHLKEKIARKKGSKKDISEENFFDSVTDLAGIRVLHLHKTQFETIHNEIMEKVDNGDWKLVEEPKAMSWDPESIEYYEKLGIKTDRRDTYYTSVHYIIAPNNPKNIVKCEIQVRTLFEEIWGEIDHNINYPKKTNSVACQEQLKVLTKLVATGTKLAESIFLSHHEHTKLS